MLKVEKSISRYSFNVYFLAFTFADILFSNMLSVYNLIDECTYFKIVIESAFAYFVVTNRLKTLNKSTYWAWLYPIPIVGFYYGMYLCIKKGENEGLDFNKNAQTLTRLPFFIFFIVFMVCFLFLLFLLSTNIFDLHRIIMMGDLSDKSQISALFDFGFTWIALFASILIFSKNFVARRLIDAGKDPYKAWLIVIPLFNLFFVIYLLTIKSSDKIINETSL